MRGRFEEEKKTFNGKSIEWKAQASENFRRVLNSIGLLHEITKKSFKEVSARALLLYLMMGLWSRLN